MIEQGIYFALGCIVTALVAMAFAPILWARALRLTRRRLQLQIPVSMQEILADRDLLRARFAVEQVQREQALERVQATKAEDMAEIGRRTVEAATLAEHLGISRALAREQKSEIGVLGRDLAEAGAEIGALKIAMHGENGLVESLKHRLEDADRAILRLSDEAREERTVNASLETRNMGLEMRLTDAERTHAAKEKRNEAAMRSRLDAAMDETNRHEANAMSLRRERDEVGREIQRQADEAREQRVAFALLETRNTELEMRLTDAERTHAAAEERNEAEARGRLDAATGEADRHEADALSLRRERDAARTQVRSLEEAVEAVRDREKAGHLQRSLQLEKTRATDRAYAERLDLLRTENAALQQALETARNAKTPEDGDEADGDLRESIHALGLAVAIMSRETRKADTAPARALGPAPEVDPRFWD